MNAGENEARNSALQFFGSVTASVSHEIKNVMAIINENAGLLDDYSLMAGKGMPIDPQKLIKIAGKITNQIQRGNRIIQNMNRFAHSVDVPMARVDISELLELITSILFRLASMREVALELKKPTDPILVTTNAFLLKNLLWHCVSFAMDVTGPGKNLVLSGNQSTDGVRITISGIQGLAGETQEIRKRINQGVLFDELKCTLSSNLCQGELVLNLPLDINA